MSNDSSNTYICSKKHARLLAFGGEKKGGEGAMNIEEEETGSIHRFVVELSQRLLQQIVVKSDEEVKCRVALPEC